MPSDGPWDIIIDLDDTCWPANIYYRQADLRCIAILQRALGVTIDEKRCIAGVRRIQRAKLRQTGYYLEFFEDSWLEQYRHLASQYGCPLNVHVGEAIWEAAHSVFLQDYTAYEGVPDTLRELKASGHRLWVVSLGDDTWQRTKLARNGLTDVFHDIHIIPRSKGLRMWLIASGGRRTMMVGDSAHSDVVPAVNIGLYVAWVHNTDPWGQTDKPIDMEHVRIIRHVSELPKLITSYG